MKTRTATRAASSLHALDEWRAAHSGRSVSIRIMSGTRGDALWQVDLWSSGRGDPVGVSATSGELAGAVRDAMKKALEAELY